jgi:phosphoribosylformylglycinamidine synthase
LSTPATDLPADPTHSILELPGQSALSAFRLDKLLEDLRGIDPSVRGVDARFVYFADVDHSLSDKDRARLDALLMSGEPVREFDPGHHLLYTAPRPGTISPWSSKATDIARACHLAGVRRIERGI